jgi:hypothetical protein
MVFIERSSRNHRVCRTALTEDQFLVDESRLLASYRWWTFLENAATSALEELSLGSGHIYHDL